MIAVSSLQPPCCPPHGHWQPAVKCVSQLCYSMQCCRLCAEHSIGLHAGGMSVVLAAVLAAAMLCPASATTLASLQKAVSTPLPVCMCTQWCLAWAIEPLVLAGLVGGGLPSGPMPFVDSKGRLDMLSSALATALPACCCMQVNAMNNTIVEQQATITALQAQVRCKTQTCAEAGARLITPSHRHAAMPMLRMLSIQADVRGCAWACQRRGAPWPPGQARSAQQLTAVYCMPGQVAALNATSTALQSQVILQGRKCWCSIQLYVVLARSVV
jgi:hypothetical protein